MTISSMTGFARVDRAIDDFLWSWEIKGVNGRNLDLRCRLPAGYEMLDSAVRSLAAEKLKRGNITVTLVVNEKQARQVLRVNEFALSQIAALIAAVRDKIDAGPPRLDGLLSLKGVLEIEEIPVAEELQAKRMTALQESLVPALDAFQKTRREEGAVLHILAVDHLRSIERLCESALSAAAAQPAVLRDRMTRKLAELMLPAQSLSEERLAQEVALLAQRADVREELDRLSAHVDAARRLLAGGGPVGRKLDFICQELNREANTICSKAEDLTLTNIGIDLKAAIEQLREQVQNVE